MASPAAAAAAAAAAGPVTDSPSVAQRLLNLTASLSPKIPACGQCGWRCLSVSTDYHRHYVVDVEDMIIDGKSQPVCRECRQICSMCNRDYAANLPLHGTSFVCGYCSTGPLARRRPVSRPFIAPVASAAASVNAKTHDAYAPLMFMRERLIRVISDAHSPELAALMLPPCLDLCAPFLTGARTEQHCDRVVLDTGTQRDVGRLSTLAAFVAALLELAPGKLGILAVGGSAEKMAHFVRLVEMSIIQITDIVGSSRSTLQLGTYTDRRWLVGNGLDTQCHRSNFSRQMAKMKPDLVLVMAPIDDTFFSHRVLPFLHHPVCFSIVVKMDIHEEDCECTKSHAWPVGDGWRVIDCRVNAPGDSVSAASAI